MNFYVELKAKLAALAMAPICELDQRPAKMAGIIAELVAYEVSGGGGVTRSYIQSQDWWTAFNAMARDVLGFQFLGSGFFSAAFSHPMIPGRVIKVGFKKEDSGAAYAAFCRANQGRMGIPNVYDIQRHSACYTVVLDHLKAFNDQTAELMDANNVVKTVILDRDTDHDYYVEPYDDYTTALADTAGAIRKFFYGVASFDMHNGNVMINNAGQLVITDPVSYTEGLGEAEDFRCDFQSLCQEIEALRVAEMIERVKARKDRHLNRAEARKAHRRIKIRRAKNEVEWARKRRLGDIAKMDDNRAWERVVGIPADGVGQLERKWHSPTGLNVWRANPMNIIHQLDAKMHNQMVRDIVCGQNLAIDRKIDAMFMG